MVDINITMAFAVTCRPRCRPWWTQQCACTASNALQTTSKCDKGTAPKLSENAHSTSTPKKHLSLPSVCARLASLHHSSRKRELCLLTILFLLMLRYVFVPFIKASHGKSLSHPCPTHYGDVPPVPGSNPSRICRARDHAAPSIASAVK